MSPVSEPPLLTANTSPPVPPASEPTPEKVVVPERSVTVPLLLPLTVKVEALLVPVSVELPLPTSVVIAL